MEGVRADEKVGQNTSAFPSSLSIGRMSQTCGIRMFFCERNDIDSAKAQPTIKFILALSLRHEFGIDRRGKNKASLFVGLDEQCF